MLGEVELGDINAEASSLDNTQPQQLQRLRQLCASIDQRVIAVFAAIFAAGLEPLLLVVANNAWSSTRHFRHNRSQRYLIPMPTLGREGRHSGNGLLPIRPVASRITISLIPYERVQAILTRCKTPVLVY